MTDPLDELRNTTKSIQQKKEANLNQAHKERLQQQELLAKNSAERQQELKDDARKASEKSRRIKIVILSILIVGLCAFLAFSIHMVFSGAGYTATRKSALASSDRTELDANDKDYIPVRKLARKILADFGRDGEKSIACWYTSLSTGRKERYLETMRKLKLNSSWSVKKIEKDVKRERFSVLCANGKKNSVTLDVVYNDDMELKLVKVY